MFGEQHLRRLLKQLSLLLQPGQDHLALNKNAPEFRPPQRVGHILELLLLADYIIATLILADHDRIVEATAYKVFSFAHV